MKVSRSGQGLWIDLAVKDLLPLPRFRFFGIAEVSGEVLPRAEKLGLRQETESRCPCSEEYG